MNHCYLELAGVIPMDDCCEVEKAPGDMAGSDHSCEDGCKDLEEAGYKLQEKEVQLVAPLLVAILQFPVLERIPPAEISYLTSSDSKTLYLPQFVIQTALPIRGPALAS